MCSPFPGRGANSKPPLPTKHAHSHTYNNNVCVIPSRLCSRCDKSSRSFHLSRPWKHLRRRGEAHPKRRMGVVGVPCCCLVPTSSSRPSKTSFVVPRSSSGKIRVLFFFHRLDAALASLFPPLSPPPPPPRTRESARSPRISPPKENKNPCGLNCSFDCKSTL